MAKTKIMDKDYDVATGIAVLKFKDGQTISVDLAKLAPDIAKQAALHGILQKIGDAAAGHGDNPDEAYEACMGVYERITTGEWDKKREGAVGERPSMVVEAVYRVAVAAGKISDDATGMATIKAKYTGEGSEALRKAALNVPQVRAEYEKLRLEAQQKRADEAAKKAGAGGENAPTVDSLV